MAGQEAVSYGQQVLGKHLALMHGVGGGGGSLVVSHRSVTMEPKA